MYKLIYIADKDYQPAADVEFTVTDQCLNITDMCEIFDKFLKAAGYFPPENHTLEYVEDVSHGRSYE